MANRIVSEKEFRDDFRKNAEMICDFSQKKSRHILGIGSRQMNIDVGVEIIEAQKAKIEEEGRTLDKKLIELHTPRGKRKFASSQLCQMASIHVVEGANAIETLWRSFGVLIPVARKGRLTIYVAKNGATAMEWASVGALRSGKTAAAIRCDEIVQAIVAKGREALAGRSTGEAYAETCTEYFKALPAAE